jgi:5-formyltetrahydrofolate cyclo-ligase
MSEKAALRKRWMDREAGLTENYIAESNAGIIRNLFSLQEFQNAETILFFYSVWSEPDTREMIRRAFELGKTVTLPKTYSKGVMTARKIEGLDGLTPSKFGIPEPAESAPVIEPDKLDFIVVPSVAFDREGYRLGHGAGYYDNYLSCTRAFACGIAREKMLVPRVPREKHDVRVNCIVTENEILRFERR